MESAHRESQDRVAEATEVRAAELLAMEQATTTERGLATTKVHQVEIEEETKAALQKSLAETEVALQSSLEALDLERKARSEVDQEVLALWGQVLGTEESNARLREQVTQ